MLTYYSTAGSIVKKCVFISDVVSENVKRKKSGMFSEVSETIYKILI